MCMRVSVFPPPREHVTAEEASTSAPAAAEDYQWQFSTEYVNPKRGYSLLVPSMWERKDKAGADVLFEDPERRSTAVGITVNPVKVGSAPLPSFPPFVHM